MFKQLEEMAHIYVINLLIFFLINFTGFYELIDMMYI